MADVPFEVEIEEKISPRPAGETNALAAGKPAGGAVPKAASTVDGPSAPVAANQGRKEKVWTVAQLTRRIRGLLEDSLPHVAVEGEVSNFMRASSGHLYFNLKDADAQLRCVMFRGPAASLRFAVEDGLQVVLRGRLSVYEARGEYQVQVLTLEPKGAGALQLAYEQLKAKLDAEGLFAQQHKQPLPFLPRRIGMVTSPTGAAIRDMLNVLARRFPGLPVLIYPAMVQGEAAAGEIAAGIAALNRVAAAQKIDVIIVGRGGGSTEDLWAFNEEVVARAIFASRVPVVSAVGHEVDFTIADFVADLRAPTPSAAAELVVPNRADLLAMVGDLRGRLWGRMEDELDLRRERWASMRSRLDSPEQSILQMTQRVDDLRTRGESAVARRLKESGEQFTHGRGRLAAARPDRFNRLQRSVVRGLERQLAPALRRAVSTHRERLGSQMELLDSLSPLTVMRRGFAAVEDGAGQLVRSAREVSPGQPLTLRMADGAVESEAKSVKQNEP